MSEHLMHSVSSSQVRNDNCKGDNLSKQCIPKIVQSKQLFFLEQTGNLSSSQSILEILNRKILQIIFSSKCKLQLFDLREIRYSSCNLADHLSQMHNLSDSGLNSALCHKWTCFYIIFWTLG